MGLIVSKVESFDFDEFKRRIIKVLRFGRQDGKKSLEASPYGLDSGIPKNFRAIYSDVQSGGRSVIIGYINQDQLAESGETRLYSEGNEIWLRKNGDIEIGGNTGNLSSHLELQTQLTALTNKINIELVKASSGIATAGGVYAHTPVTIDISSAKLDKIKV